jgi:type 1 glutamine amidotransferase
MHDYFRAACVDRDAACQLFVYSGNLDFTDYLAPDSRVLVKCRWSGGKKLDTAVSWYRTPGKGRVFYTNFAKVDSDYSNATVGAAHILPRLRWAVGF